MKVVYRGNFLPQIQPFESRWSTEHQVALTLEALDHQVIRLQEDAVGWDVVEDSALRADLFLWTQTSNVDPDGGYRALARLRDAGIPTVSFHLDLYIGLAREHQIHDQPFWRSDYVFTADGGHDDYFAAAGVNHHWLTPAIYEPDTHQVGHVLPVSERFPVIFVGSYPYPHAEHAEARQTLIATLNQRYGSRSFRVYRNGYRGQKLTDLYASASVVVGDSCLAGRSPRYWSDRIPETVGRGGFLIHPYIEGIEKFYTDGEHLRLFEPGDFGQLVTLVDYYLAHREERETIARTGRLHVREHHTYDNRMRSVLGTVFPDTQPEVLDAPVVPAGKRPSTVKTRQVTA